MCCWVQWLHGGSCKVCITEQVHGQSLNLQFKSNPGLAPQTFCQQPGMNMIAENSPYLHMGLNSARKTWKKFYFSAVLQLKLLLLELSQFLSLISTASLLEFWMLRILDFVCWQTLTPRRELHLTWGHGEDFQNGLIALKLRVCNLIRSM